MQIDLAFLATHSNQLLLENLVSKEWGDLIKAKMNLSKQHNLTNQEVFRFFDDYKISYNTHSLLHHSYMRCKLLSFSSGDHDISPTNLPQIEREQYVVALVDIFGFFVAFSDSDLNYRDLIKSKKTKKESENQRSQLVIFKDAQSLRCQLIESESLLTITWTIKDIKGAVVWHRMGLTCNCENPSVYLREFYQNLMIFKQPINKK
jgi:hypothetical protein